MDDELVEEDYTIKKTNRKGRNTKRKKRVKRKSKTRRKSKTKKTKKKKYSKKKQKFIKKYGGSQAGSGEKIISVFLLDVHYNTPEQLKEILLSRPDIKNIAYFQEQYRGPISGTKPRKDKDYDWQETKKIPEDKNVLIFPCGSRSYGIKKGDKLYMSSFLELLNNTDLKLEEYDAFIISTGHSYPIATTLLPPYEYTKSIKIYDLQPFQVYERGEHANKPIVIRERHEKFKETIYNHEPFEIKNLLKTINHN